MRLSAEMYEQIVAALKSDSHRERDKRLEPRVGLDRPCRIDLLEQRGQRFAHAGTRRSR